MKTSYLFLGLLALAGAVNASDVAQKSHGQTVLKTNHTECSTPSGKATRECARAISKQAPATPSN